MAPKYIPAGTHTIVPHLSVTDGAKAIEFYKKVLGAEEVSRALAPDGKIMHACLQLGDSRIYVSDMMGPQQGKPSGIAVHMWSENPDAVFDRAVKAGATVSMPLADMFWGDRYGHFTDPFGQSWAVAKHLEDLSTEEMQKRGAEFFKSMGNPDGNCAKT
ncbi:MAG: VOC family protein [Polyangiales bacterium]